MASLEFNWGTAALAKNANECIQQAEKIGFTDIQTAVFTQAVGYAAMGILAEVHRLRVAVEEMQAGQKTQPE